MWGNMGDWSGWGWGGMGFGPIGMVLFWILLIAAIVVLVKVASGSGGTERRQAGTALDILKERYARGEITKEQFDEMRHNLKA